MEKELECISLQRQLDALREKANTDETQEKTRLGTLQTSLESSQRENSRHLALYTQSKKCLQEARHEKWRRENRSPQAKRPPKNISVPNTRTDAPVVEIRVTQSTLTSSLPTSKQAPQVNAVPTIVPLPPHSEPVSLPRQQPVSAIGSPPSVIRPRRGPNILPTAHTSQTLSRVSIGFNKSAFGFPVLSSTAAASFQDVVMEDARMSHVVFGPQPTKDVPMDVDNILTSHSSPAAPPAWDNEVEMAASQPSQPPAQIFDSTQLSQQPFVSIVNNTQPSQTSATAFNNTQPIQAPGSFAQQIPISQNSPSPIVLAPSQVEPFTSLAKPNQTAQPTRLKMGSPRPAVAPIAGPSTSIPSSEPPVAKQAPAAPEISQEAQAPLPNRADGGVLNSSFAPSPLPSAAGPSTSVPSPDSPAATQVPPASENAQENPGRRPQARLPRRAGPSAGPRAPVHSSNETLSVGRPSQPAHLGPSTHAASQQASRTTLAPASPQGIARRQGSMSAALSLSRKPPAQLDAPVATAEEKQVKYAKVLEHLTKFGVIPKPKD
ncbi:hypothetical protein CYLTODRAFT_136718 [Cylindrobasidium torrendii FP15055 ss-10]|uniref:Uncharacterized protein n=1 Tax=Cylindrobasidium torrendii FP15055 ss-10 TaxID=1314674 RepID=A0A0D7AZP0_9AGAR|nr:hypothetical protein CYLTODRAFT_136718 [Cylindrobasidium torrendii FP15055 ss-10]